MRTAKSCEQSEALITAVMHRLRQGGRIASMLIQCLVHGCLWSSPRSGSSATMAASHDSHWMRYESQRRSEKLSARRASCGVAQTMYVYGMSLQTGACGGES